MKRIISLSAYIAIAVIISGCAKTRTVGPNDADKRYLEAWMQVNGIDVAPSGRGIYIIEESKGDGVEVTADGFVMMDYVSYDLEGNIKTYTSETVAKQLGEYSVNDYYGPKFTNTFNGNIYAGLADMLFGMKAGGRKKALIPSWLFNYNDYETEESYLAETSSIQTLIYDITVRDFTPDINVWEADSIGRFFSNDRVMIDGRPAKEIFKKLDENGQLVQMDVDDTVKTGFYYKQLRAPVDEEAFPSDTTIYINYTGMTLDGRVFDTTYEKVAKDNNIYSASKTYEPVQINWADTEAEEDYTGITMGSGESEIIKGFALTLWQMKAMEEGVGVFYSSYGYSGQGSGSKIPPYSSLIFQIEIVEKPE